MSCHRSLGRERTWTQCRTPPAPCSPPFSALVHGAAFLCAVPISQGILCALAGETLFLRIRGSSVSSSGSIPSRRREPLYGGPYNLLRPAAPGSSLPVPHFRAYGPAFVLLAGWVFPSLLHLSAALWSCQGCRSHNLQDVLHSRRPQTSCPAVVLCSKAILGGPLSNVKRKLTQYWNDLPILHRELSRCDDGNCQLPDPGPNREPQTGYFHHSGAGYPV